MRRKLTLCFVFISALLATSCASIGVQPWERDVLAREAMQLDANPAITGFHDHIYFSKEGSAGGRTYDGGGCGCN